MALFNVQGKNEMTITAKNYAAQAEKSLLLQSKKIKNGDFEKRVITSVANRIKESVKFALPRQGLIFNDELKSIKDISINLPFDNICLEFDKYAFYGDDDNKKIEYRTENIVLAYNDNDNGNNIICISCCDRLCVDSINHYGDWELSPILMTIDSTKDWFNMKGISVMEWIPRKMENKDTEQKSNEYEFIQSQAYHFFEFIEALSCTNVEQTIHQQASLNNAQRIKSHKLPIYETKVLTIKASEKSASNGKIGYTGTHASPRQHLRRGHIRRLENGNIWVNSCVVGDKEKGVIKKSYNVV